MTTRLTPKQIRAIHFLIEGRTALEVADLLRTRRETVSRWRSNPVFKKEYERQLDLLNEASKQKAQRLMCDAIGALKESLTSSHANPRQGMLAIQFIKAVGAQSLMPGAFAEDFVTETSH
jgi:hypothetical protein